MGGAQQVSGTLRIFVLIGAAFFVSWQAAVVIGLGRHIQLTLALYGFIFHVLFGKAYALIPAYFDAQLVWPNATRLHLLLAPTGTLLMATGVVIADAPWISLLGALCWGTGAIVFVGTIGWTVRDNLTGGSTGTGTANRDRRKLDRLANAFIPITLGYFLAGTYGTVALAGGLPPIVDGNPARVTHLLAAGTAGLLVFAIGARLLPRLFVATPPYSLAAVTLISGALGPAILAVWLWRPPWFLVGGILQTIAVFGYAGLIGTLLANTARRRTGQAAIAVGAFAGVLAVLIGLELAVRGWSSHLVVMHYRLLLVGFLGLTIIGVLFHLYPPSIADLPGAGPRLAAGTTLLIAVGLGIEVLGLRVGVEPLSRTGSVLVLMGGVTLCYLLVGIVHARGLR